MMMAAMKAKQGILNMANIDDMMEDEVSTKELVDEGAEFGASFPVEVGAAVFPGSAEFPDGAGFPGVAKFPGSAEFGEGLEFGASVPGGDMNKFMGVVDELGSSCSAGW